MLKLDSGLSFLFFVHFLFISHTQRNQRPRGEIGGQVDKLTFFYLLSCKKIHFLSKIFYTAFQKTPHTQENVPLYDKKKSYILMNICIYFTVFSFSGKPIDFSFVFHFFC